MATVEFDKIKGHGARFTRDGWEITRTAIVRGVSGDGYERIKTAYAAIGLAIGDPYPGSLTCGLQEAMPTVIDNETIEFQLVYRDAVYSINPTTKTEIEVGASVTSATSNKDASGKLITVSYTYPTGYNFDIDPVTDKSRWEGKTDEVGKELSFLLPQTTLSFRKRISYNPESEAINFVGKINSSLWRGYAAKTWLCTGIVGRSSDAGSTYDVTYSFQYDPDHYWKQHAVYIDPRAGVPPKDLAAGTGDKWIDMQNTANFNLLNLN